MSTKPVQIHIPVDIMHVMNGPSIETMLAIPHWSGGGDPKENTVRMTLRTDASPHHFMRKVFVLDVKQGYESLSDAMAREDFEPWDFKLTGDLELRGIIGGSWEFEGTYNPQTRKGTLRVVAPLSPEAQAERDLEDLADTHAEIEALWRTQR